MRRYRNRRGQWVTEYKDEEEFNRLTGFEELLKRLEEKTDA